MNPDVSLIEFTVLRNYGHWILQVTGMVDGDAVRLCVAEYDRTARRWVQFELTQPLFGDLGELPDYPLIRGRVEPLFWRGLFLRAVRAYDDIVAGRVPHAYTPSEV